MALTMNPSPEVSAEAKRHMSRGVAAIEGAKTPDDFKDACNEFRQATTLAPWMANAYRNLAIAQDKAGMYDESLASLRLYLLTKPSPSDADWAEDLKFRVEYRKEKAAKDAAKPREESSTHTAAAPQLNSFEVLLKKIDGRRYTCPGWLEGTQMVIDVRSKVFTTGDIDRYGKYKADVRFEIKGRTTTYPYRVPNPKFVSITYTISEDGDKITRHNRTTEGDFDNIYLWER